MGVAETTPSLFDPGPTNLVRQKGRQQREVCTAWLEAPGMIQHRASYFEDAKIRGKIDRAVKKYGVEDVTEAIRSYAEVLVSPDCWWSHRWTFGDFLQRGLDKFVPEAEPQQVFAGSKRRSHADEVEENIRWLNGL